jgi:hypothetical protein
VIGILASAGFAAISRIDESANTAKDQRNAQTIVTVYTAAKAAGLDFDGNNLSQTVRNVVIGSTVTEGSFTGAFFGVPGLSIQERNAARDYLDFKNGMLEYVAQGK